MTGTRLRLREVRQEDGSVIRKLGHKVRLAAGPAEIACTNLYLDDAEWALLDQHEDVTLVAEIDDHDQPSSFVPAWLDVVADVSDDERWTGVRLAR